LINKPFAYFDDQKKQWFVYNKTVTIWKKLKPIIKKSAQFEKPVRR